MYLSLYIAYHIKHLHQSKENDMIWNANLFSQICPYVFYCHQYYIHCIHTLPLTCSCDSFFFLGLQLNHMCYKLNIFLNIIISKHIYRKSYNMLKNVKIGQEIFGEMTNCWIHRIMVVLGNIFWSHRRLFNFVCSMRVVGVWLVYWTLTVNCIFYAVITKICICVCTLYITLNNLY